MTDLSAAERDRFERLASAATVGISEGDILGNVIWANQAWRELTGIDGPLPLPPDAVAAVIHPEGREQLWEAGTVGLANDETFEVQVRMVRPDGTLRHVAVWGSPTTDEGGQPDGFLAITIDQTDIVERREELTLARNRYRRLIEQAPVGQAVLDLDGIMVDVNQAWADILGRERAELIGSDGLSFVHPDDRDVASAAAADLLSGKQAVVVDDRRVLRKGGTTRVVSVNVTLLRDVADRPTSFLCLMTDITELRRATDDLRRSEALYRAVVESLDEGILISGRDGTRVANERAAELLGTTQDELQEAWRLDTVPVTDENGEPLPPERRPAQLTLDSGAPTGPTTIGVTPPDGRRRWLSVNARPWFDSDDTPAGVVVSFADDTDRKSALDALRASESRYRAVVESLREGILILDTESVLGANTAAADILGLEVADLLGPQGLEALRAIRRIGSDGQPIPLRDTVAYRTFTSGEPQFAEGRMITGDGGEKWMSVAGVPLSDADDSGPVSAIVMSISDDTERHNATEALRRSEERYRLLVEHAPIGQMVVDAESRVIEVNRALADLVGEDPASLLGEHVWDWIHPDDRARLLGHVEALVAGDVARYDLDHRIVLRDGTDRWVRVSATLVASATGGPGDVLVLLADIDDQRRALDALRRSEERFRTLAEELPVAVFLSDRRGQLVYSNPQWRELVGRSGGQALAEPAQSAIHPVDVERVQRSMVQAARDKHPYHEQYRLRRPDQPEAPIRWVSSRGAPLLDDDGRFDGYVGYIEDISRLMSAQEETSRLAEIVESTSDLVSITDLRTHRLAYLNRAARETLGMGDRDITEVAISSVYTDASAERFRTEVEPRLLAGQGWTGELELHRSDGSVLPVWSTFTPGRDVEGDIRWVSSLGRDVTERRRLEHELAHRATHDPLTNLPNRIRLLERLEEALVHAGSALVAVLFLDLDRFKQVNDLYGHDVGDQLLTQVADRIANVLRPTDTVARLGGDEFVILCEDIADEAHAMAVGKRICGAIEAHPFLLGEVELPVTASVGIALSSGDSAHSEVLLRDADAAMYRAKDRGRARLELFDDAMRRRNAERLQLTDELADGIERGEIRVHYQPCIDLRTGRVTALEALARWEHPERGLLGPKDFIGLAEDSGLIIGLGLAVLTSACEDTQRWAERLGNRTPRVHVNLSARQILAPNLTALVRQVLERTGLAADLLALEITESVLMEDTEAAVAVLSSLTRLGVGLAIDDFGTGYSSLSYLRRFPVDILKIDGSFVEALGPDPADAAFVGAIVNLAHSLGLEAIAEGVETQDQLTRLRLLGCGAAQGYLFSPPRPFDAVSALLHTTFAL